MARRIHRRNPTHQIIAMLAVAFALFALIGWVGVLLDPSTEAQRACIKFKAQQFLECVYDLKKQMK